MRLDAGLSGLQLSGRCGWHSAKTSRIEHGKASPTAADIQAWCAACGREDQAAELVEASRHADQLYAEWRRLNAAGLLRTQQDVLALVERTRVQRVYCSNVVPGFLQTAGYATALLGAITRFQGTPDDVEAAVSARMERGRALHEGGHRFVVLLEESVLRYRIGGPLVMREQLAHLDEVIGLPSIALGVIPFTADRVMWPLEAAYIFDGERVTVETLTAEINVTVGAEVRAYERAFVEMGRMAVYGPMARALIDAAVDALG